MDRGEADAVDPKAREVLDSVLEYRQLTKIKSTYVDALPALVNAATGRLHTRYNQTGSATGRVSSNDPNVQNIPVRTELGKEVRKAFVAQRAPEWELFAADYSQIELRVLAHVSQDPGLLEAFRNGQDIHDATASSAFGVPLERVDVDMRRIAKIMNFGVIYGLSPFGISQQTGLSAEQGASSSIRTSGATPESRSTSTKRRPRSRRRDTWRRCWAGGATSRRYSRGASTCERRASGWRSTCPSRARRRTSSRSRWCGSRRDWTT